jgi:hypothetical protein
METCEILLRRIVHTGVFNLRWVSARTRMRKISVVRHPCLSVSLKRPEPVLAKRSISCVMMLPRVNVNRPTQAQCEDPMDFALRLSTSSGTVAGWRDHTDPRKWWHLEPKVVHGHEGPGGDIITPAQWYLLDTQYPADTHAQPLSFCSLSPLTSAPTNPL